MDFQEYCKILDISETALRDVGKKWSEVEKNIPLEILDYALKNSFAPQDFLRARKYDIFFSTESRHTQKMTELINEFIEGSEKILDLGCGTCTPTFWLALQNTDKKFYALDQSPINLAEAKRKKEKLESHGLKLDNVKLKLIPQGIYPLPFEDEFFDVVYQCRPPFTEVYSFREMYRVLKGNSFMLTLKILGENDYEKFYKSTRRDEWINYDHVPQEWGRFKKRGMRIFDIDGDSVGKRMIAYMGLKENSSLSQSGLRYSQASSESA